MGIVEAIVISAVLGGMFCCLCGVALSPPIQAPPQLFSSPNTGLTFSEKMKLRWILAKMLLDGRVTTDPSIEEHKLEEMAKAVKGGQIVAALSKSVVVINARTYDIINAVHGRPTVTPIMIPTPQERYIHTFPGIIQERPVIHGTPIQIPNIRDGIIQDPIGESKPAKDNVLKQPITEPRSAQDNVITTSLEVATNTVFDKGKNVLNKFNVDSAYVKPKHLSTTGGSGQKFLGNSKVDAELILKDVMKNGTVKSITDNGLTKAGNASYEIILDSGKTIGTRGETLVKIVLSEDGGMLSAYPVK